MKIRSILRALSALIFFSFANNGFAMQGYLGKMAAQFSKKFSHKPDFSEKTTQYVKKTLGKENYAKLNLYKEKTKKSFSFFKNSSIDITYPYNFVKQFGVNLIAAFSGAHLYDFYSHRHDTEASPTIKNFCKTYGYTGPVKISPALGSPAAAIYNKMHIDSEEALNLEINLKKEKELDYAEQTRRLTSEQKKLQNTIKDQLVEWGAIVQHEHAHIKHKDSQRIPIALAAICAAKAPIISKFSLPIQCTAHLAANTPIFLTYMRHIEQQADDAIDNNIKTLQAAKRFFEKVHIANKEYFEKKLAQSNSTNSLRASVYRWKNYYIPTFLQDPMHPTPLARAKKFEQRIAKLEAQQATTKKS